MVPAIDRGDTVQDVAVQFEVSERSAQKLLKQRRETSSIAPRPNRGGRKAVFRRELAETLKQMVQQHPDSTLEELRKACDVSGSLMCVWRGLKRLKITRKKSLVPAEQRTPAVKQERETWQAKVKGLDPSRFVFQDEANAKTTITRLYGRAPRVVDCVPDGR